MHYNFGKTFIVELFNTILPLHIDDTTTIAEKLARLTIFINRMRDTAAQTPAISEVWDRAISAPLNEAYRVQDANVIRDLPSNEPTKIIDEKDIKKSLAKITHFEVATLNEASRSLVPAYLENFKNYLRYVFLAKVIHSFKDSAGFSVAG